MQTMCKIEHALLAHEGKSAGPVGYEGTSADFTDFCTLVYTIYFPNLIVFPDNTVPVVHQWITGGGIGGPPMGKLRWSLRDVLHFLPFYHRCNYICGSQLKYTGETGGFYVVPFCLWN